MNYPKLEKWPGHAVKEDVLEKVCEEIVNRVVSPFLVFEATVSMWYCIFSYKYEFSLLRVRKVGYCILFLFYGSRSTYF